MISYTDTAAKERLTRAFVDAWGSTTPVQLDNEQPFLPPTPTAPPAAPAAWARCVVRSLDRRQATMGSAGGRRFDRIVLVIVQIFVQAGCGTELANQLADQAGAIFEGVEIDEIDCYKTDVLEIGADGKGWYQANVQTRARYQTTK